MYKWRQMAGQHLLLAGLGQAMPWPGCEPKLQARLMLEARGSYCMRKHLLRIPEKWLCEACLRRKHMDDTRISDKKRMGSPQTILGSPPKCAAHSVPRNMKMVETGKVKFLAAEDVLMLSSGAKTKASIIRGRLGSQTCSSRTLNHPSMKRATISVAEASKRFSQKASPHKSSGPSKPSVLGIGLPSSSLQPRVAKTSPQLYDEKSPVHSPSYRSPSKCSGGPMEREAKEKPKEPQRLRNADAKAYHSLSNFSGPMEREAKEKPKEPQLFKNADAEAYPSPLNCYGHMERVGKEKPKEPQLLRMDKSAGKDVRMSPNKEHVCKEEPVHGSLPAKGGSSEHASSPAEESKIFSRFEGLPDHLAIDATWKGSFEILGTVPTGELYEGLQAYPPGKTRRKTYEVSKQMPRMLQFKLHPRCDVWPEIFHIDCPTGDDIALYFLPGDFKRSKEKYSSLLNLIEMRDLAMQSCLNGVELLIFTSKQLPADSQRINMKFYLWGVFRSVKKQNCSSSKLLTRSQHEPQVSLCNYGNFSDSLNVTNGDDTEGVDMEIDMIGGKDVGRIDKPIQKLNSREKKVQFKLMTPKRKCINSNVLDHRKNLDQSAPRPLAVVKTEQPIELEAPPGFSILVSSDAADKCLLGAPPGFPKPLKREERGDSSETNQCLLGAPPGFPTLKTKGRGDSSETNPCLLGAPPGFPTPLKTKERGDSSETNHKKDIAGILDGNTLSSSKKQRSSFSDTSKRDFMGSSLQPQKPPKVSKSPEFPWKCHQVAMNPPMHSVTTDLEPLSEIGKKGFDAIQKDVIQYDIKDGLLCSLPKNFQVWDDLKTKANVRVRENLGVTEHEKKEPSSKRRHKTVVECLQLFPKVENTEDQQLETNNTLKQGSSGNKLVEDKHSPVLSLSRPLYLKDGQRWITGISKELLQEDGCDDDVKLAL
ncbi:hypothetical protein BVC80_8787g2 [Macleaya cordata]|uniref:AIPP2-like SPOC-like domain-containing protein n=1 Tax=Macleaya cordata TaxID=56857 RepID=A0A200PVA0_MACCD|nr:hypothetical protein BVC80_8787g2 [Macleaya cordata]